MSERDSICAVEEKPAVEYRPIPAYAGYRAGSDGTVWWQKNPGRSQWRKRRPDKRYPFPRKREYFYPVVAIMVDGRRTVRKVSHLILEAFVGPRPTGLEACHANGDQTDNSLGNLRWGTHQENIADRAAHGSNTIGEKSGTAVLTQEHVDEIRRLSQLGMKPMAIWRTGLFPVGRIQIHRITTGECWPTGKAAGAKRGVVLTITPRS